MVFKAQKQYCTNEPVIFLMPYLTIVMLNWIFLYSIQIQVFFLMKLAKNELIFLMLDEGMIFWHIKHKTSFYKMV